MSKERERERDNSTSCKCGCFCRKRERELAFAVQREQDTGEIGCFAATTLARGRGRERDWEFGHSHLSNFGMHPRGYNKFWNNQKLTCSKSILLPCLGVQSSEKNVIQARVTF